MSHFISFERGRLSQKAHLYFAYHLRLHPCGYQKREDAVKYKIGVEVEGVEAEGVIAQFDVFAVPMRHADHIL